MTTEAPTKETHTHWVISKIEDLNSRLLLGFCNDKPIGVLRFDIDKKSAEVSIYVDPGCYGHGYGSTLLGAGIAWLKKNLGAIKEVKATVLEENIASKKIFLKNNFKPRAQQYVYRFEDTV